MTDYTVADTIYLMFTTRAFATGIPTVLAGTPVVSAYENDSATQITAGITLGVSHDSVVGMNLLTIVATGANGYEAGKDYNLVITTGTVGGVSVVGEVVGTFSLGRGAAFTRLGAPAGASVSADILVIDNFVDGIETAVITNAVGADISADIATAQADLDIITDTDGVILGAAGVDLVWDEVLTGATHNIANSAGRILRQLKESASVYNGRIFVDTIGGVNDSTSYEAGTSDNPVLTIALAKTIHDNIPIHDFHIINGSSIAFAEDSSDESYFGDNWALALGGQEIGGVHIQGADPVTGISTAASAPHFDHCDIGTASIQIGHFDGCTFTNTLSLTAVGNYKFHDCQSGVAGTGAPTFAFSAVAITAEFRRWAGSITFSGLTSDDTITIGGTIGTIDLGSPASAVNVEVRGTYKEITNVGSASVNVVGAILGGDVASTLADTTEIGTAGAGLSDLGGMSTGMKAEVNAEVVDTLATDTYAEPGQETPAATGSLANKINYMFKAWRNRSNQTATTYQLFADDATTVDQKATVSDDATTAEKGEVAGGP